MGIFLNDSLFLLPVQDLGNKQKKNVTAGTRNRGDSNRFFFSKEPFLDEFADKQGCN